MKTILITSLLAMTSMASAQSNDLTANAKTFRTVAQPSTKPVSQKTVAVKANASQQINSIINSKVTVAKGSEGVGGGDLCEDRIQQIRDDIKSWIYAGGSADLRFSTLSMQSEYKASMLEAMASAKIQCVKPGDAGYPVQVNGTAKVCRFDKTSSVDLITCDYQAFLDLNSMSESDQYILIHHEFAGLAGLENPNADVSTYFLSNQISGYLEDQIVKKLVVKRNNVQDRILSCQTSNQRSQLVVTDVETGKNIVAGSFQGGGWSDSEATKEAAANCNAALSAQARCISRNKFVYSCQADEQESQLIVTNIETGKKISMGSFQGGGWSASESIREAAANCLNALIEQTSCE